MYITMYNCTCLLKGTQAGYILGLLLFHYLVMLKNIKVLQQNIFDWVIIGGCTIVPISQRLNLDQLEI
jgi:hypothetical protein